MLNISVVVLESERQFPRKIISIQNIPLFRREKNDFDRVASPKRLCILLKGLDKLYRFLPKFNKQDKYCEFLFPFPA